MITCKECKHWKFKSDRNKTERWTTAECEKILNLVDAQPDWGMEPEIHTNANFGCILGEPIMDKENE